MWDYLCSYENDKFMKEILSKLCQTKCSIHKELKSEIFCDNLECISNSKNFLCAICVKTHNFAHKLSNFKPVETIFSTTVLEKVKTSYNTQKSNEYTDQSLSESLKQIDNIMNNVKDGLIKFIEQLCTKAKETIKEKLGFSNDIKNIITGYHDILKVLNLTPSSGDNFPNIIKIYLENFNKLSDFRCKQIQQAASKPLLPSELLLMMTKLTEKSKDLSAEFQKATQIKFTDFENSFFQVSELNDLLIKRLKNIRPIQKFALHHTKSVYKILCYDDNTKYITCSTDTNIIIRNALDNRIINTLKGHSNKIRYIHLLKDGRLASCSDDTMVIIWNLEKGISEQILMGHSAFVTCLLELPDSKLITGSFDQSIRLWEIKSRSDRLCQHFNVIQNDKQKIIMNMCTTNTNEFAISSQQFINIYHYNDKKHDLVLINVLKGHNDIVLDMKPMLNQKEFLISSSTDKECRLWSLISGECLRKFIGHVDVVVSLLVLSDKIFASSSTDIRFWHIDKNESFRIVNTDELNKCIYSMTLINQDRIACCGQINDLQVYQY